MWVSLTSLRKQDRSLSCVLSPRRCLRTHPRDDPAIHLSKSKVTPPYRFATRVFRPASHTVRRRFRPGLLYFRFLRSQGPRRSQLLDLTIVRSCLLPRSRVLNSFTGGGIIRTAGPVSTPQSENFSQVLPDRLSWQANRTSSRTRDRFPRPKTRIFDQTAIPGI